MRFARRVADYRVHPPRCPHACRTATACVPQPTQCPRQQRASEPHTPQAVADVGLHMARHMKAASCRLLRSHAAVDGTPRRLTVSHRAPRPAAALPRLLEDAGSAGQKQVLSSSSAALLEALVRRERGKARAAR